MQNTLKDLSTKYYNYNETYINELLMFILERLLRGAASWHRTYEDAGTFLGFAFTKRGIRCRAASDAGLHPKNAGILICAMQRSSDAGAASRHHPAYINHEYQQKNWKIKKKVGKYAKKRWKMPSFALVNAKAASDAFFASDAKMPLP